MIEAREKPETGQASLGRERRSLSDLILNSRAAQGVCSILVLVAICSILELALPALGVQPDVFPVPSIIARQFWHDLGNSAFYQDVWTTVKEVLLGWALGAIGGIAIGIALTQSRLVNAIVAPYVVALNAVPKIALAPILITIVGFGIWSKVVMAAITGFLPLVVNTYTGIESADGEMRELMRSIGASRFSTLRHLSLPCALPHIIGGLEVGMLLSLIGAIVGEFTGASSGLGYLIDQRNFNLDAAGVFSALLALTIIGLALDLVVRVVGKRLTRWRSAGQQGAVASTRAMA